MPNYTSHLRALMQPLGFTSFRALSQAAGVSEWQLEQLRKGQILQLRVATLAKLSQVLQKPISELLAIFSEGGTVPTVSVEAQTQLASQPVASGAEELQREYQRLQTQLVQQQETLRQEFQQASLQILESWLLQFPTAAYAVQQNPQLPASRLLPLLRPLEQLLQSWGIESIAPVGTEVAFDPQWHQLMEGTANPGEMVKIRYAGYRQGDKLLYRAKVSPAERN
ncbi:MAG: nucleotide exchange factor GrpE [Cyanobacteria bacterium RM1_2_2]|nr:nucleotide exchange factor GrpE [Cyanobacteria bacterium RM1_2_2]